MGLSYLILHGAKLFDAESCLVCLACFTFHISLVKFYKYLWSPPCSGDVIKISKEIRCVFYMLWTSVSWVLLTAWGRDNFRFFLDIIFFQFLGVNLDLKCYNKIGTSTQ